MIKRRLLPALALGLLLAVPAAAQSPYPNRSYAEKFSWQACAEEFIRNLQPYPEPAKTKLWNRLRSLTRRKPKKV